MKKSLLICTAVLAFSGCMTTTADVSARQSNAVFFEPKGKSVYISTKNTSHCAIHLKSNVASLLEQKGYKITENKEKADITLQAQVLHCDHKRENNKVMGALAGAGVALGISSHNHSGGWAKVGWSALGAAIGGTAAHLIEDETWDLQVDVRISPKGGKAQTTTIFAKASKMNLSGEQAAVILEEEAATQIAKNF